MILVFLFQFLFLETYKDHSLDTQIKTGKIPVNKVKNERGDIITYTTEVQIQNDYYEKWYTNELDNLEEIISK